MIKIKARNTSHGPIFKLVLVLLIYSVLLTSIVSWNLSLSKYVLNTTYPISLTSAPPAPITAIGAINGTTQVAQTLTAGALTPGGATADYQWQRCATSGGTYTNISGATSTTYILGSSDLGSYVKVVATGSNAYTGTVTSSYAGPVTQNATPVTAIANISGTTQVGSTLTAGTVTPGDATVTYQWLRCATSGGTYTNISGATSNAYVPVANDVDYYIKVSATGTGTYSGTVTSAYAGAVTATTITAIGNILGTTTIGFTLTAGALTPSNAAASYQWQRCDTSNGTYTSISGAASITYTLVGDDLNKYIKVVATGTSGYTGAVSAYTGPVAQNYTPITAIGDIAGTAEVLQTLTAGALTPSEATASYQWQRCFTLGGAYTNISGATSSTYTLVTGDVGYYIKVRAAGTGSYSGSVTSNYTGPVSVAAITAIGSISGTVQVGLTLTAGALTPSGATANYQWQKCLTSNGTYTDISGATSSSYTPAESDLNYYIKVSATGAGGYSGTVTSTYTGPVAKITVTGIGNISGTTSVGLTLTAGALTPSGATVSYQWQRCATAGGTYTDISGATSTTYTLAGNDLACYIQVVAAGTGTYSGTATSNFTGPVSATTITAIANIIGTTAVGQTLTAGAVTPAGATVAYQWQKSSMADNNYSDIPGATSNTLTLSTADRYLYFKVVATGTSGYTGSITSFYAGPVTQSSIAITGIGAITGTVQTGSLLTAGALTPSGATATYQWKRCVASGGTYTDIPGAISSTYTLTGGDYTYYIKVTATGTIDYSGSATSAYAGPVAMGPITAVGNILGTSAVGSVLTARSLTPSAGIATYKWQRCDTTGGTYVDISGATSNTYTLTSGDLNYYIKVVATGISGFSGSATSAYVGPVTQNSTPITAIANINGTARVLQILTAGTLTPSGATVSYQWQKCATSGGTYTNIPGATSNTYTAVGDDYNYYIKVAATGTGAYSGTVTGAYTGPMAAAALTSISSIIGSSVVGQTLTAGALAPYGAVASYQWQSCSGSAGGTYTNIPGGTNSAYTLKSSDRGSFIKVVATGTSGFSGTVTSVYTGIVTSSATPLTAIGNISGTTQYAQTLTAGVLTPGGATATYQWQKCATSGGTYSNIYAATSTTYTLTAADVGYYIKVAATGSFSYSGTVTSAATGPVTAIPLTAIGNISGTARIKEVLTAGILTPSGATVTYQWQICDTSGGTYTNIPDATLSTCTLGSSDRGKYIKVVATGTGGYSGIATSAYVGPIAAITVTAIGNISGTAEFGATLTAGTLTPSDATVTYQWSRCLTSGGVYADISGATSNTYVVLSGDLNYYIKVTATGTVDFTGTVNSAYNGPVAAVLTTIAIAAIPGVTTPAIDAAPVSIITATSEYTGTVTWSPSATVFAGNTVYTATIMITPKAGYKLTGVTANFFTVSGATATNPANSGAVTAVFPATN